MDKLEQYADVVNQMVDDDKDRDELYQKIDDAVSSKFEPSAEVKKLPWVQNRHYGMTNVADARNTGARTFSTLLPQIDIAPLRDDDQEYQRTENAEQIWQWEFERMNRVQSKKGFHDRIVESAVTYHSVAFQTEYLPYKFKGKKDNRQKALLSRKKFNWSIHHPGTVHSHTGEYDQLERVAKVVRMTAQELIDNFGETKGIAKLKAEHTDSSKADLMKMEYTLVDYMDWDNRIKWAYPGHGSVSSSDIVFMNEEHELPFLPWVVIDYGEPLWQSIIQSGLWENFQYVNMLIFAKAIEQSTRSTIVVETPDGTLENIWIDFSNPSNPIVVPAGSRVSDLRPAPIDPQMSQILQELSAQVASSTVSSVLTNIGQYSDAPFSTVERIVQLALGQLSPAKKSAEAAEEEGIYQGFQWIEHSDIPLVGYRTDHSDAKEGDEPKGRGEQIAIWPGKEPKEDVIEKMTEKEYSLYSRQVYFDLEQLYINVNLQANNVADEQSRLNLYINMVDRMGMSKERAWEEQGLKNFKLNEAQRIEETMLDQQIQLDFEKEQAKIQMEMQAAQMQMQQQVQQEQMAQEQSLQAQQQEMNSGSQFASAQGVDMRNGGQPAAMQGAPLEGRVQVNGQADSGLPTQ